MSPKLNNNLLTSFSRNSAVFFMVFVTIFSLGFNALTLNADSIVDLNFVVTDQNNIAISGATINIDQDFGNGTSRTTDGSGFANFGVVDNTSINYSVSANGCNITDGNVDSAQGTTVNVTMNCGINGITGGGIINPSSWPQNIQYSINDNGSPVVYYYNVKNSGPKVFRWNVDVNFNGPGSMHVRTIGAYDETAGSAATIKHPFGVDSIGTLNYQTIPSSGSFSFSYDTTRDSRLNQCGRVQIDGSFIVDATGSDSQLFYAIVIDYGVDCPPANQRPVITLIGSNPVNVTVGSLYIDQGATAQDPEDGNITANIVKTGTVNTAVVGTYTVTYNVSDSQGLAAEPVRRTVIVTPANQRPVITLVGSNPVNIVVGNTYTDAGATAQDVEDGNITANIVKTGTVNTAVVGTYTITYNVSDSQGLAAIPVTRTVNVVPPAPTVTLTANPINVPYGQSTTLSWSSTNAQSCFATNGWLGSKALSGNEVISNLTLNKTFIITCTGQSGTATSAANVIVGPQISDISITKTANKSTLNVGDTVSYTITVSNTGPNNATGVSVTDILSNKLSFVSATSAVGSYATTTGVWSVGNLDNNQSLTLVIVAIVKVGNEGQVIGNTATVVATQQDPNSGNNIGSVDIIVNHNQNHPPVITLIGANPATVIVGNTYIDAGATALDQEDGNITANIVKTGTVNTAVVGTYTITYNVSDSQGLAAIPVSRTVNVLDNGNTAPKGHITFCLALANDQNVLATSSVGLPTGLFTLNLKLSTSTNTALQTQVWNTASFTPNTKIITLQNDANCVTYSNLELGTYYYSTTTVNGLQWNTPKYNDKYSQSINNVFDFFNFSPELFNSITTDDSLRNMNSDGQIILTADNRDQSVTVYVTYNPATQCLLPEITSPLTAGVVVNNPFTYTLTASSSISTMFVATTSLPAGLTFSATTNQITGTPTQTGTFNINLTAVNNCGTTTAVLILTVGTGGGGSTPTANLSITKTEDKTSLGVGETVKYIITVVNHGPDKATGVKVTENFPSSLNLVSITTTSGTYDFSTGFWTIGDLLNGSSTTLTLIGTVKSGTEGQKITNLVSVIGSQNDPNASDNTTSVDLNVNPAVCTNCGGGGGGGGGNGPIVGSYGGNGPIVPQVAGATIVKSCYYLYDYLRKDFNNNPVEVKKLQVFLRDLEGFTTVQITGIYDDQTIVALNAFQWRYKDDVLTPWGHTAPTSYTYILTKKKVNEIYCKMAFPVTPLQQAEIDAHRHLLESLRQEGITVPGSNNGGTTNGNDGYQAPSDVGLNTGSSSGTDQSTLAGVSTTTQKIAGNLTANVLSAGKKFAHGIASLFTWPFRYLSDKTKECVTGLAVLGWINILLILIVIITSYFWYREYRQNKVLESVNKEIDLK